MRFIYESAELAASLFDGAGAALFLTAALGRKERFQGGMFYPVCLVFVGMLGVLPFLSDNSVAQIAVILTLELVFSMLFLKKGIGSKLFFAACYDMILLLTNFFVIYGLALLLRVDLDMLYKEGTALRALAIVLHKALLACVLVFLAMAREREQFEYQEWLTAFFLYAGILAVGSVLADITKAGHLDAGEEAQLIGIAIGLLAVGIAVSICIYKLNKQIYYRTENKILNMRIEGEKDTLGRIGEMYEDSQILRHDLKRYLTVALGMLYEGEVGQAIEYLEEVTESRFGQTQIYLTNSSAVNSVLNGRVELCRKNGISYEAKITGAVPERGQAEVSMILSNLIDNAVEAEMKEEEEKRRIEVGLSGYKGMFMIRVENYIGESVLKKNPELLTDKKDGERHGVGIKSVRKMVRELDGTYLCGETGHTFFITILLPEE